MIICNYCDGTGSDECMGPCIFCGGHGWREPEEYSDVCEECGEDDLCDCHPKRAQEPKEGGAANV